MATSPDAVRVELAVITTAAATDLASELAGISLDRQVATALSALPLLVPSYYDAAGSLAVDWYDELRDESRPSSLYVPNIIGDPTTDWIEREVAKFQRELDAEAASLALDLEAETQKVLDEIAALAEKEIARGYRDSILGNARQDEDAIGWSRIARPGACKLCKMAADRGAVYREETASFAAHKNCHCVSRPEFRGGNHGHEASVEQYLAAKKRRSDAERARLRAYLNEHYPDSPG